MTPLFGFPGLSVVVHGLIVLGRKLYDAYRERKGSASEN